ncbi:MAG: hypothetical protein H6807_01320 [Planctomycetes bacterium]|nr:hypothetical protein [Planctomycetota bacterium]
MIPSSRAPRAFVLVLAALALVGLPLQAHVKLDSPNGGQTLTPGQVTQIVWHPTAAHATIGWDLEYSLNGSAGPWLPIALNIAPGDISAGSMHVWYWVVPATDSGSVRVRVRQVNNGTDYTDVSDADLAILSTLAGDVASVSVANGGSQLLSFTGGAALGGSGFITLGNFSGTIPGIPYQGFLIPLNQDFYFDQSLLYPNLAPFTNSLGALAGDGSTATLFSLGAGALSPAVVGVVLHHAVVVVDAGLNVLHVSNPVPLQLAP